MKRGKSDDFKIFVFCGIGFFLTKGIGFLFRVPFLAKIKEKETIDGVLGQRNFYIQENLHFYLY